VCSEEWNGANWSDGGVQNCGPDQPNGGDGSTERGDRTCIVAPDWSCSFSGNDNHFNRIPPQIRGAVRAGTFGHAITESTDPMHCREVRIDSRSAS
jgi:hypothetical protein